MPLASGSHLDFPDTDMSYFQTPGVAMSHYSTLGGPTFALKYNERHVRYALSQMLHHRKDKTIHYDTHTLYVLKHDSKQQALFFFPAAGILPLATSKEIQEALWGGMLLQG